MFFAIAASLLAVSLAVTCPRDDSGCVNVVSPCRVTQCDRADVTCCVVNCKALFLLANGTEYQCGAVAPTCPKPDCTTVRCGSTIVDNPCANVTCKSNPRLKCCAGCCNATKFIDETGAEAKCPDSVPAPVPAPSPNVCPTADCSTVRCAAPAEDPCKTAKCAADSTATCCAGCCGQTTFINRKNETVKCDVAPAPVPVPSPVGTCPRRDCSVLDCIAPSESPCKTAKCAAFPNAKCCDSCCGQAQFIDEKSNVLDCEIKPTPPTCPKVDCSNLRCPTPIEDPCKTAKCESDPSATCCTGCCGQTTFIDARSQPVNCSAPNPCLTVRCSGDKDTVYKNCVATFGDGNFELVQGRCCYECKPKLSCATVLCADLDSTKAACQKRFGDKPFTILAPDANRCCYECAATVNECAKQAACPSVDDVTKKCEAENGVGKYAISKDQCGCATCQPIEQCATVRCASPDQLKADCTKSYGEGQYTMTKDACCQTCTPTNPCRAQIDTGSGKAFIPSFGFDGKQCVKFVYGGAGGNANRFDSVEKCASACGVSQQMTSPSLDTPDDATAVAVTASALIAAIIVAAL